MTAHQYTLHPLCSSRSLSTQVSPPRVFLVQVGFSHINVGHMSNLMWPCAWKGKHIDSKYIGSCSGDQSLETR
jgi:hypothetical protein